MLKFLGILFLIGVAFAIGYQMGRQGPETLLKKARDAGAEMIAKAMTLERTQSLRASLVSAKERLVQAKSDMLDKNYGKAVNGLEETAHTLSQAKVDAEQELRPKLDALTKKISDLATDAKALKPGVITKINEAVKEIDGLLNR
jgi:hypothetical protein